MNSFILEDSSTQKWQVTVDDNGILHTTAVGSGTVITVILNDQFSFTSWQMSVSTAGNLSMIPLTLALYPTALLLVSNTSDTSWYIGVTAQGNITTTEFAYTLFPSIDLTAEAGFNWKLPLKVTPSFKTLVQTPANNRGELRISLTPYPIWIFQLEVPYIFGDPDLANDGFQALIGLYGKCQGAAGAFLFDWPGNDSTTNQNIGTGDGIQTVFPMVHTIGGLTELIQNFQTTPSIYVNGVLQSPGAFSIDQYGNLTLGSAPNPGDPITWSGSWYTLCRFIDNELQELQLIRGNGSRSLWTLKSLKFKSVLL